jgi:ABC-type nickel/cobalt efflux system permease component RcnA
MRIFLLLGLMMLAFFCAGETASAQQTGEPAAQTETAPKIDKRKLLVPPKNADGTLQQTSFWEDPVLWIREKQQSFYGSMSRSIRQIKSQSSWTAALTLMLLSFGYGVFHAAGPGHGKAVISAWLLATENELKRGIFIAFLSSVIQALTAIAIVSVLLLVVASVGATARNVAGVLESFSYAMIAVMGLYLVWSALRPHIKRILQKPEPVRPVEGIALKLATPVAAGTHSFSLDGNSLAKTTLGTSQPTFTLVQPHVHDHHHHDENCGCGHAHVPEANQVRGNWSLAKAFSLAFAVGIRPCTGAILVLIFANALGLYWAGVISTFVMSIGTFLTVSVIAALTVYSKNLALKLAERGNAHWVDWAGFGLRLGCGILIAGLGALLFMGSLGSVNAMM